MNKRASETAVTVGLLLFGGACGQDDLSRPSTTAQEMAQGEPIQGDPIQGAPIGEPIKPAEAPAVEAPSEGAEAIAEAVASGERTEGTGEIADTTIAEAEKEVAVIVETASIPEDNDLSADVVLRPEPAVEAEVEAEPRVGEKLEVISETTEVGVVAEAVEPKLLKDGSLEVSFDRLASFEYEMPEDLTAELPGETEGGSDQIPEAIRDLNLKSIALKGFMLPLKVEEGLVTEMLIMRDQSMCCYGTVPKINEWVSVRMDEGKGVKPVMDEAVTMFGKLKVGEIRENGYLVGIYEMDGDRMDGPADL